MSTPADRPPGGTLESLCALLRSEGGLIADRFENDSAATLLALKSAGAQGVDHDGTAVAVLILVAIPVQVITLVLAARMTSADVLDYFALRVPRWRDASLAIAVLAAVIVLGDVLTAALGRDLVPASELELYRSAHEDGTLFLLLLALQELLLHGIVVGLSLGAFDLILIPRGGLTSWDAAAEVLDPVRLRLAHALQITDAGRVVVELLGVKADAALVPIRRLKLGPCLWGNEHCRHHDGWE